MLGGDDQGVVDISTIALNAAISGSLLADPEAYFLMTIALPFGSIRALATAQDISRWPACRSNPSASLRSAIFIAPVSSQPWRYLRSGPARRMPNSRNTCSYSR